MGKSLLAILVVFCFVACKTDIAEKKIAIQPLDFEDAKILNAVAHSLTKDLGIGNEVIILPIKKLPESAFTNVKSPRYRADSLIRFLKRTKPDSIDHILGFTSKDISTTKKQTNGKVKNPAHRYQDWGIFGLGYTPGSSCVVSTFRLKGTTQEQTLARYKKVCLHEIGHNLGLKHCRNKNCVMTDACESIKTVDRVIMAFCRKCKLKI